MRAPTALRATPWPQRSSGNVHAFHRPSSESPRASIDPGAACTPASTTTTAAACVPAQPSDAPFPPLLPFCPSPLPSPGVRRLRHTVPAGAASNLDETNLQPARAVAPRSGPMDDNGSHSISAPNQSAIPIIKTGPRQPRRRRDARECEIFEAQTKLANQQDHNRYEDGRNCGEGDCSFIFLMADALQPRPWARR